MSYLDFQLLLYVPSEQYEPCRTFYEQVFATQPFYGWDEGPEDRGVKYDLAGTKLVLLTQENPFPTSGAVHFQLQVPTLEDIYPRAQAAGAVTQEPFFRPYGWHMFRMADPAGNHINIFYRHKQLIIVSIHNFQTIVRRAAGHNIFQPQSSCNRRTQA